MQQKQSDEIKTKPHKKKKRLFIHILFRRVLAEIWGYKL